MDKAEYIIKFLQECKNPGTLIFAKVWGSHSHNTNLSTSNIDYSGVFVLPITDILSIGRINETIDNKNPDYQLHEIGKFGRLLLKGNPAILEMLYTNKQCYTTKYWKILKEHRDKFLSKSVVNQYLGYACGQLKKLIKGNYLHTSGGRYNTKWAYHLIRLLDDGIRIADGEGPLVWKEGKERDKLMSIRNGEWSQEAIKLQANEKVEQLKQKLNKSDLPEEGDKDLLNEWILYIRKCQIAIEWSDFKNLSIDSRSNKWL